MIKNRAGIEADVHGWNWGALMFNWVWGIGNKTYLPLIALIPGFGLIWAIICGAMGNKWAWQNSEYGDYETFQAVQKTWNLAGIVQFIIAVVTFVFVILLWGSLLALVFGNSNY
ncbi:hypothetical protein FC83_GL000864 [Agrilactobacillus composti DSM 18527 = JCM 14202]|uniref:Uncharacterized protein n=1 Tax=Agrilactobacillus composti DSM 18527 = JCM 14202 TaxID=1423734 RepID=X0QM70_9LACO|nr:hypothetical protein [Agrilactobacillus composti]KRM35836.1 hypothetical protein FC83_GL000864 [Agrilactobacillus composti DSM 18527 = JCM 14202]MCH4170563.1 ribonuclease G [Lactobacillus sp.]GAF39715.1 hypothetical protein JCM14202_1587 [Agrilactobacillus composti DSM 18527 = JCM 14202]